MPTRPRNYFNLGHGYVNLSLFLAVDSSLLEIKIWFVAFFIIK